MTKYHYTEGQSPQSTAEVCKEQVLESHYLSDELRALLDMTTRGRKITKIMIVSEDNETEWVEVYRKLDE